MTEDRYMLVIMSEAFYDSLPSNIAFYMGNKLNPDRTKYYMDAIRAKNKEIDEHIRPSQPFSQETIDKLNALAPKITDDDYRKVFTLDFIKDKCDEWQESLKEELPDYTVSKFEAAKYIQILLEMIEDSNG